MKKKITVLLLILFLVLSWTYSCFADEQNAIEFLEIIVNIEENGDATIVEKWTTNTIEALEYKKSMVNLKKDRIEKLMIRDEVENEDKSFSVVENENGIQICWKEEKKGFHNYTLQYTIKSFVKQFTDKSGFCMDFLSNDTFPQLYDVQIMIKAPFELSKNNVKISKFGFNGDVELEQGNITISNVQAFKHITLLGEFKKDAFQNLSQEEESLKNLKKQLQKQNPIALKKSDIAMIVILTVTAVLYVGIEGYYLIKTNEKT